MLHNMRAVKIAGCWTARHGGVTLAGGSVSPGCRGLSSAWRAIDGSLAWRLTVAMAKVGAITDEGREDADPETAVATRLVPGTARRSVRSQRAHDPATGARPARQPRVDERPRGGFRDRPRQPQGARHGHDPFRPAARRSPRPRACPQGEGVLHPPEPVSDRHPDAVRHQLHDLYSLLVGGLAGARLGRRHHGPRPLGLR